MDEPDDTLTAATAASGDAHAPTRTPADSATREAMLDGLCQFSPSTFEVGAELGRGGIGRVMRARDPMFDRPIAIKELLSDQPEARARFLREAMITARLQHPSIVPVYLAGKWPNGAPFYAMKLVDGQPLSTLVRGAASLAARIAMLPSLLAVCDAIAFAHRERIIHRDLKPGNVLVGDLGETLVIDWGLAKDLDAAEDSADTGTYAAAASGGDTIVGSVLGTPAYMAPEQAAGRAVDERADVYALGAMLYELLVGKPPYADIVSKDRGLHVLEQPPTPIAELVPDAPRDLVAIAERAMQRDPAARYADAREIDADLRRFTAGKLVSVREYGALERLARWMRRHRAAVTVGGIAALVTLVIGIVAVVNIVDAKRIAQDKAREADVAREREAERADAAVLARAVALVESDPTAAVAALSGLRGHLLDARPTAADAASRGIAMVLSRTELNRPRLHLTDDDRYLIATDSDVAKQLVVHDLTSGTRSVLALSTDPYLHDRTLYTIAGSTLVATDVVTRSERRYASPVAIELIEISPSGTWLVARTKGDSVIWNAATGVARSVTSPSAGDTGMIAISDQGVCVEVSPRRREVWVTTATERKTFAFPAGATTADNRLAFPARDAALVPVADRAARKIHLLDTNAGTWTAIDIGTGDVGTPQVHGGRLYVGRETRLRYTPVDGTWTGEPLATSRSVIPRGPLTTGLGIDHIWVESPERTATVRTRAHVASAVVSRSGETLYAALADQTIRRWDLRAMDGPVCGKNMLAITPHDAHLVGTARPGELLVCDPAGDRSQLLSGGGSHIAKRMVDARGAWILTSDMDSKAPERMRWDRGSKSGTVVVLPAGTRPRALLDDGRVIATSETGAHIVDPVTQRSEPRCAEIERIFSNGAGPLPLGVRGGKLVACDVARDEVIELAGDAGEPDLALGSADGTVLVVHRASHPDQAIVWSRANGSRTVTHSPEIGGVSISRDGRRIALVTRNDTLIVDAGGTPRATIRFATRGEREVVLSPTGDRILVLDLLLDTLSLHDIATGTGRRIPGAPSVTAMEVNDDGTMVFVAEKGFGYRAYDRVPRDLAGFEQWLKTVTNAVLDDRGDVNVR